MKILKKLSKYLFEDVDDEEVAKKIDITPKEEVKEVDETMEFQEATNEIPPAPKEEEYIEPSFKEPSFIEPIFPEKEEKAPVKEEEEIDFMVPSYNYEEVSSKESYWKAPKKTFKPSPIISPIYGVRKMEEPYQNDEIVLSASPVKKRSIDEVRKKAYSYLSDEKEDTIDDKLEDTKKLSVTVGDAKDYYDELGLEYNVDYKDSSIEEEKQAKVEEKHVEVPVAPIIDEAISKPILEDDATKVLDTEAPKNLEKTEELKLNTENEDDDTDTDLFDLIEGMYVED